MSKFIRGLVTAMSAIGAMIAMIDTTTIPAAASPNCMTKEEAIKVFPGAHIYWHGRQHCWDNNGQRRANAPTAAKANGNDSLAKSEQSDKPVETAAGTSSAAAVDQPGEPIIVPPIRFIGDDVSRGLSWPVLDMAAPAQQDDSSPARPSAANEDVVIGAPGAAPGSPEYLLENCCWPPTSADGTSERGSLRRLIIASTSACGLATGLWLFVYRRRQLARVRWS